MAAPHSRSSQDSEPWQCTKKISRKLVVCIDGTSNKFGQRNTNIVELYSHIIKSDDQLTYYSSGLGTAAKVTGPSLRNKIPNTLDMVIGRNVHKVIMASYRWLSDNYRDGDSVFLFGFSRGAYQVRALAGMIARVGLLLPGNNAQIPFAFDLYSQTKDDEGAESKKKDGSTQLAKTFKETFCRNDVHIHFIGVWDTVSSVGFGRRKILPCTTNVCNGPHFCYFRHALALDERRVKFLPEYIYCGQSVHDKLVSNGRIKEVWFAGCHADVGGGNRRNAKLQLGDIPLLWMRDQATAVGLKMKPADIMWKIGDLNKRITNSLRFHWWLVELCFIKHLSYRDWNKCTRSPHLGCARRIVTGQKVHVSVLFKHNYKPFARFHHADELWPDPMFWNHVSSHERLQNLSDVWEKDIFDHHSVRTHIDQLNKGQSNQEVLGRLAFMSTFKICKEEIETCEDAKKILTEFLNDENKVIQLSIAVMYCELGWSWPADADEERITKSVSDLLNSNECRSACIYLPSLCKKIPIPKLMNEENLKKLVELCVGTRIDKSEEKTSTVAFPGVWTMSMLMKRALTFQKRLVELCNGKRTEISEETSTTFFESAHALSMLMELYDDLAQRLVDMEVVPDITKMLHYKGDSALVALLSVVDGLARHLFPCPSTDPPVIRDTEKSRDLIEADTMVPIIHKLLKHYDDFVAPAAIRVLCSFLPNDKFRDKILQCNVPHTLCRVLRRCSNETRQVACNALVKFMEYDILRARMLECKVFSSLFDVLRNKCSDKTTEAVCNVLVGFMKHDDSRDKMLECDVFRSLRDVLLLYSQADETAQVVCNTLVEFVKHHSVFQEEVLKHNVFKTLLDLKLWKSEQSMKAVCKLLVEFAKHDNLRDKMFERDELSTLCGVLGRRSDETTQAVCTTLGELMQYDRVREKMLECDLFPALYDVLQQRSGKTVEVVSNTLIKFVEYDSLRTKILQNKVFFTLRLVLRQWNSDEHKQSVCNILVEFVKYDNLRDEMLEWDMFPPLSDVLCARWWSDKTKQKVCNTLVELVKYDKLRDKILQYNVLHTLSQVLRRCSDETLEVVCNPLVIFMKHDILRGRMLECTVLPALFDVLHRCSDETAQPVCNTLVEFMEHENSRDKMVECDVFSRLDVQSAQELRNLKVRFDRMKLDQFAHINPVTHKARMVELANRMEQLARKTLIKLVERRDKISECMMFPTLFDVFDRYCDDTTTEVVYLNTLVEIMKHETLDMLFKSKVLHILCYLLGQCQSDRTKKAVCKEFVEFVKCDTGKKKLECMVLPTLCYVVSQHSDETKQVACKTVVDLGKPHGIVLRTSRQANNLCISLAEVRNGNFTESGVSGAVVEDMHEAHSPLRRVKSQTFN